MTTIDQVKRVFDAGRKAAHDGQPYEANPWPARSRQFEFWVQGFYYGLQEVQAENEPKEAD